jgi:hypothetical protein
LVVLPSAIEALSPLTLHVTPRRRRLLAFQMSIEQGLQMRRQIFVLVAHRLWTGM